MSGGSYNYLCFASAEDIGKHFEDIRKMAGRLLELGYEDEARLTLQLLPSVAKLQDAIDPLQGIWHAVEWMDSGDSGIENVREAVAEFRAKQ